MSFSSAALSFFLVYFVNQRVLLLRSPAKAQAQNNGCPRPHHTPQEQLQEQLQGRFSTRPAEYRRRPTTRLWKYVGGVISSESLIFRCWYGPCYLVMHAYRSTPRLAVPRPASRSMACGACGWWHLCFSRSNCGMGAS